jgi:hypothetical protein
MGTLPVDGLPATPVEWSSGRVEIGGLSGPYIDRLRRLRGMSASDRRSHFQRDVESARIVLNRNGVATYTEVGGESQASGVYRILGALVELDLRAALAPNAGSKGVGGQESVVIRISARIDGETLEIERADVELRGKTKKALTMPMKWSRAN